jgi:hypothetical protein
MMRIKTFESFNNSNTLYIFDFDDTLVKTPNFLDLSIEFLKEGNTIKDILISSTNKIGVRLDDLRWENGKIYVSDPQNKLNQKSNWVRKGNRLYLTMPSKFPYMDISLPSQLKETAKLYNSVENKCIVTARPEDIRGKIIDTLNKLGLENPKYGLHMFPSGKGQGNPGWWKAKKIVEILKKTGFENAHFYDDNSKTINKVNRVVKEELPFVNWKSTKVK